MFGLNLLLIAKKSVQIRMLDVSTSNVKTGLGNKSGNKGSVMVRFQLEDTSFVFMNNHLSSGVTKLEEQDRGS